LSARLENQLIVANRRGRRIGATAISVHQAMISKPHGTVVIDM
jgi:hypothetical protein